MKIFIPSYYKKFRCLASLCPDSCCKEWEIDIDEETSSFYETLPGELGEKIRQFLCQTEDGTVLTIQDGKCPMWRQDGLCEIQKQLGHQALSQVCQKFPRLRHDYGDFIELGLELSCPEAARLILTEPYKIEAEDSDTEEEAVCDPFAMAILKRSRNDLLSFLENSSKEIPHKLAVMLIYAHDVQDELDGGEKAILNPDLLLKDAVQYAAEPHTELLIDLFQGLEILTESWKQLLSVPPLPRAWVSEHLAFVKYGIYRYWYQAISDYDLLCRVKMIIGSCLLIRILGENSVQTAQLFSKEIENDPENMDHIFNAAYCNPGLTDVNLLSILLNF